MYKLFSYINFSFTDKGFLSFVTVILLVDWKSQPANTTSLPYQAER